MLFSLNWLLELCPVAQSPARVAAALTDRGLNVDRCEPHGDDHQLDLDIPANRPDCLGHLGVARELSAAFGVGVARAGDTAAPSPAPPADGLQVEIANPALCPRYTARIVRGVKIGPSPAGVVQRLELCGLRSINNVVDVSNLVLLELGHPVHFFDLHRLRAAAAGCRLIRIKLARAGERLVTLDGVERMLDESVLVIADAERPLALAGIIGGADSEISAQTTDILIEAACFDAQSIRATSRRLGLQTEASYRFARGCDPQAPPVAQQLAGRWLADVAGAASLERPYDAYPAPWAPRSMQLHQAQIERLLGFDPPAASVRAALDALGLQPAPSGASDFTIRVPSYRLDLEREADLVEEVARHMGYEQLPARVTDVRQAIAEWSPPAAERCRDLLATSGFHEAIGYAMIGAGEDEPYRDPLDGPPLRLTNPIAEPAAWLRRSILPGLLRAVDLNLRRGARDVRLFEIARVFLAASPGLPPREPERLGLLWTGAAVPPHWSQGRRDVDLFDLLGVLERLFAVLGWDGLVRSEPGGPAGLHPGQAVTWHDERGTLLARAGALHPAARREISQPVYVAELDLDALGPCAPRIGRHGALSNLPTVWRDLSLQVQGPVTWERILGVLRAIDSPAPSRFEVVDRYEGTPLPAGTSSLTVRIVLEPRERTLTDPETEDYRKALVDALARQLGVGLRG